MTFTYIPVKELKILVLNEIIIIINTTILNNQINIIKYYNTLISCAKK